MSHSNLSCFAASLIFALFIAGAEPASAGTARLAAHRAVYDITLKDAEERSGVNGVRGRMVIELLGSTCEGWTVNFRMINQYLLQRGMTRLADNRSSTWESGDGNSLRYSQRQYVDNNLEEESLLKVGRDNAQGPFKGEIIKPAETTFELANEVVFPVQHQLRLMAAARNGEMHDRSIVFDGSEGSTSYLAVAFIGKPMSELQQAGEGAGDLKDLTVWPVTISYFSREEKAEESVPLYQVSFRMFDNGVSGDLVLDYGEFTLDAKLTKYEPVAQEACQ